MLQLRSLRRERPWKEFALSVRESFLNSFLVQRKSKHFPDDQTTFEILFFSFCVINFVEIFS